MNDHALWWVVILMGLVTYLPRLLPIVLLQNMKLPGFFKRQFEFIPYTVLSAIIFPGVLHSTDSETSALVGTLIAVILAFYRVNLLLVVLSSIAAVYLWGWLVG